MRLTTERLTIRMLREPDAAVLYSYRILPEVAELQDWDLPYTMERALAVASKQAGRDDIAAGEWTQLAVDLDGEMIGDVVCHLDDTASVAEIGYTFRPEFQGRGYASEATGALVDHILATTGVHRIEASLDPTNIASMRVLEAVGLTMETLARRSYAIRGRWDDDLRYAMLREDRAAWLARPRTPPASVQLAEITADDAHLWARLSTHWSQRRLVAPVSQSYMNALFPEVVDGAPVAPWMRGVLADGERVGFVMTAEVTEHHPEPYLWRLLVDRMHQRRGLGRRIIRLLQDRFEAEGHRSLLTSWVDGPGSPRRFYEGLGFQPTGNIVDGEVEARLRW